MNHERDALVAEMTIQGFRSADDAALLVDARLTRIMIRNSGMLDLREATGWLRRDGSFLPCGDYAHDRLLHCLGLTAAQAEGLGWVRLTLGGVTSTYRIGPRQRTTIRDLRDARFVVDDEAERGKPVPPAFERVAAPTGDRA